MGLVYNQGTANYRDITRRVIIIITIAIHSFLKLKIPNLSQLRLDLIIHRE